MNRRILAVVIAIGVLGASNAFASRARNLVMGTGEAFILGGSGQTGSFYFDDGYNIFYNPAYVNDFKNWGIIEKSNFSGTAGQGTTAMGGAVASVMNINLGLFFNRSAAITGNWGAAANDMTPIDLIIGGDMGVKWGLGLTWGATRTTKDLTGSDITLRAGVSVQDFEPFVSFKVSGTNKLTAGVETKNKAIGAGLRYHYGEWIPYVAWNTTKITDTKTSSAWGIGLARSAKMSEGVRMNYAVGYWHQSLPVIGVGTNSTRVPVSVSVEADAASWITARAGLTTHIINRVNEDDGGDATTGRIGATMHLGKADFDFGVGSTNPTIGTATEVGALDTQTMGIGPGLFTAASLAYHW